MVLEQLPVRPVCVTSNGAVLYDAGRDEVATHHLAGHDGPGAGGGAPGIGGRQRGQRRRRAPRPLRHRGRDLRRRARLLHLVRAGSFGEAAGDEVISVPAVKMIAQRLLKRPGDARASPRLSTTRSAPHLFHERGPPSGSPHQG